MMRSPLDLLIDLLAVVLFMVILQSSIFYFGFIPTFAGLTVLIAVVVAFDR